jgi:hypothetical protein
MKEFSIIAVTIHLLKVVSENKFFSLLKLLVKVSFIISIFMWRKDGFIQGL